MTSYTLPWLPQRLSRKQHASLQVAQYNPPAEQTSGFFRLSPEMRNMIYDLVIVEHEDPLWVTARQTRSTPDIGPSPTPPPLAQVCHQLRHEALPVYYGVNDFSITLLLEENVLIARSWLAAIGDIGVLCLRNVKIHGYAEHMVTCTAWVRSDGSTGPSSHWQRFPIYAEMQQDASIAEGTRSQWIVRDDRGITSSESRSLTDRVEKRMRGSLESPTPESLQSAIESFAFFCDFRKRLL